MEQILLPNTIEFNEGDQPNVGEVVITPCHQGYGTTMGNALRRVLISSLPGAAIESVHVNGVQHEFSAIDGVQEDMVEIVLNLKLVAVQSFSDEPVTLTLSKKGKGDVTAADFDKNADVEIINPKLKLFTITDAKKSVDLEVVVGKGRGYVPVEEKDGKSLDLGTILVDSLYTPIRDIGFKVEMTRVGDVTNYEKLVMTIETNGTISAREAVSQATKILMDHFALVLDSAGSEEVVEKPKKKAKKKVTKKKEEKE